MTSLSYNKHKFDATIRLVALFLILTVIVVLAVLDSKYLGELVTGAMGVLGGYGFKGFNS